MSATLAALPIATALALLILQSGPVRASLAAVICGLLVAVFGFAAPLRTLAGAQLAMAPVALEVALILLGGLTLAKLMSESGAQTRLGHWVVAACQDRARGLLLVVLGVVPFAESVTGFGIGVVVGIPLLVQLGLSPARAAVAGLLGLVIVPWGSLGPGTLVAARLSETDFQALGIASAWLSAPVFLISGAGALALSLGARAAMRSIPDLMLMAGALWLGVLAVNMVLGTPLAGVLGSLFAIGTLLARARLSGAGGMPSSHGMVRDAAPFLVLVTGLLAASVLGSLLPPAFDPLMSLLDSPALWLLVASAAVPVLHGMPPGRTTALLTASLAQWWPIAVTTVLFLVLGVILASSGMSAALAEAGARLGPAYPAIAPWIGAMGGFLTGSNTGASAMFATSQAQAAHAIGYPVLTLTAFQNVGASIAIMAAIPKVMMAARLAEDAVGSSATGAQPTIRPMSVLSRVAGIDAVILIVLSILALTLW